MRVTFDAAEDGDNVHTEREAPIKIDTTTRRDLDALTALNRDYIHSVQNGDVQRFDEILAEDFLCSNPDGSLVDKAQFLAQRGSLFRYLPNAWTFEAMIRPVAPVGHPFQRHSVWN